LDTKVTGFRAKVQEGTFSSLNYPEETIIVNQADSMKNKLEIFSRSEGCPIRNVLDRFGDKWSVLVLLILGEQNSPMRFNELLQTIGNISQKMLTVTLRTLEADGLITRKHYHEIPPRVEYGLTGLGESLLPHINGLADWSQKHYDTIMKTRKRFEKNKQMV
jgi:DNA-binding HxlR family transcriptional regulator